MANFNNFRNLFFEFQSAALPILISSFLFQMQLLIAIFTVVVLSSVEAKPFRDDPEPEFCHGLECPHFKTINKTNKYELRCYQTDYKWASTVVAGRS